MAANASEAAWQETLDLMDELAAPFDPTDNPWVEEEDFEFEEDEE